MKHLLESELHKKLPKETGAFSWIKIKRCPVDNKIYQDFCMDYGCQYMKDAICEHPQAETIKEGYLNTSIRQATRRGTQMIQEVKEHKRRKKGGKRKCVTVESYTRKITIKEDVE